MKATITTLVLLSLVTLMSCSKKSDDNLNAGGTVNKTEQVSGEWNVSSYFDSGKDETSNYSGYTFTFNIDGTLTASSSSTSYTGTWRIGDKSSDDDNSSNRFIVSITGNKQMVDLSNDWLIVTITDSQMSFKDDNSSSMEQMTFSRKHQ